MQTDRIDREAWMQRQVHDQCVCLSRVETERKVYQTGLGRAEKPDPMRQKSAMSFRQQRSSPRSDEQPPKQANWQSEERFSVVEREVAVEA